MTIDQDIRPAPIAAAHAMRQLASRLPGGGWGGFLRDLFVSGALPWIAVAVLQRYGVALVPALAISAIFPLVDGLVTFVRAHRFDAIGAVNLVFIVASIGLTVWSGDVHVTLLKGVVLTGAFSLLCLGSLLAPKPLLFFLGRQFSTRGDPALVADWNARWAYPRFRRVMRVMTAVWGLGYALEVVVRTIAAYTLPPLVALGAAPVISYGVLGLLIAWTVSYGSAMRRKYAAPAVAATAA
jgi:hypothetical protein